MPWLAQPLASAPALFAQQMADSPDWFDKLARMSPATITIILIFGTGFVSAILYGLTSLVRAYHGAPDEADDLAERLDAVEKRLAALEKSHATPA